MARTPDEDMARRVTVQARITPQLDRQVRAVAKREGVAVSTLVREGIKMRLKAPLVRHEDL